MEQRLISKEKDKNGNKILLYASLLYMSGVFHSIT